MIGKTYSVGRMVNRYSGQGGMRSTNFSEVIIGIIMLGTLVFFLGSCTMIFFGG
jgi:hypothetical protein